jgi:hypothetical protein
MGATATLRDASLSVDPGGQAATEIRVRNDGAVVDQFTLDVVGDASGWASVEPPTLSLFPGAEQAARVVFSPPRVSTTPAGAVPFGVRVRSREDPSGSTVEEGSIEVAAFVEPFAELVPRTSRGSRAGTHEVAVDNRGNARLNAELSGADPDQILGFDIDPPALAVDPGKAGFARLKVRPRETFWRGTPKTRSFQLLIQGAEGQPIALDGSLLQEAMLPPWFMRAVLALIALLIGLVLFWLLALRPSIEAAAADAVEAPIASLRTDINDALAAGGLPTLGPTASKAVPTAAPSTSPSASGSTPPNGGSLPPVIIPNLGTPVDGRLKLGANTFAPATAAFITDLIFENPSGRSGKLILRRDDTILADLNLDNFRDWDYHQVTPIVIAPGQTLILDLNCGDGCDASVFYNGYQKPGG